MEAIVREFCKRNRSPRDFFNALFTPSFVSLDFRDTPTARLRRSDSGQHPMECADASD